MNKQSITLAEQVSFKDFLFKDKHNRAILKLTALAIVVQFSIFKYFYPQASFIHGDSFSYLTAAYQNLDINTYMIGYSKFLRLFSVFFKSDVVLVAFQYLLIQSSAVYLLFTLSYLYRPSKIIQVILLCFIVFNPLLLNLANLISSDGLFLAISLIWFSNLIWIINRPSRLIILTTPLILFIAFTLRYNALIFPFITVLGYYFSNMTTRQKLLGIGCSVCLCGLFVVYTGYKYKSLVGIWQYSPFSGWQLANNGMYAYRYVKPEKRHSVPVRFKKLDEMVRIYFDSTRNVIKHPQEMLLASTAYMWDPRLTLFKYRDLQFAKDTSAIELKKWASMGPLYADYGRYIIFKYPQYYLQHFLWINANKYFAPPVEFLEMYNSGKDSVIAIAQVWFNYKSLKVNTRMKSNVVPFLRLYPIFSGIINMVMLLSLICFILLKRKMNNIQFKKGILLSGTMWILNASFTIFGSSAALRFQSFPIILATIFSLLIIDWLFKLTESDDASIKNQVTEPKSNLSEIHPVSSHAIG